MRASSAAIWTDPGSQHILERAPMSTVRPGLRADKLSDIVDSWSETPSANLLILFQTGWHDLALGSTPLEPGVRSRRNGSPACATPSRKLGQGPRWLETEAGLARGAATKILDGKQQTSNHVDAISKVLGLTLPAVTAESPDEAELLTVFRGMTPEGKVHLLGVLRLLQSRKHVADS
jgi:hypothetical protein